MKKTLILVVLSIIAVTVLGQSGILDALLAFLLVGAIPGTAYSVPSGFMMLLMAVILWLLILQFIPIEVLRAPKSKRRKAGSKTKRSMPRRRFSQI